MLHLTSKSLIDHRERARALSEWERAFWWMGKACLVTGLALVCVGLTVHGYLTALLSAPLGVAQLVCGRAVDRNVALVRGDISDRGAP
jgi:hypothetical protein